jgi:hypothetical protein
MKFLIATPLILCMLAACAPQTPIVEVSPNKETVHYNDGKGNKVETNTKADGSTEVSGTTSDGKSFSMSSKKSIDLSEYGLKEYPNIIANDATTQNNIVEGDKGKTISILFTTKDPINQVTDFYEPLFIPKDKSVTKTGDGTIIGGETNKGAQFAIIISKSGTDTQVSIIGGTK